MPLLPDDPAPRQPKLSQLAVKLPQTLIDEVDELARQMQTTRSAVIRSALVDALQKARAHD